jgi:hypothetical protein
MPRQGFPVYNYSTQLTRAGFQADLTRSVRKATHPTSKTFQGPRKGGVGVGVGGATSRTVVEG